MTPKMNQQCDIDITFPQNQIHDFNSVDIFKCTN